MLQEKMAQHGYAEMSEIIFKDHCDKKIANFKDARVDKDSEHHKIMEKVKKMQSKPKMPDFSEEDEQFGKDAPDRVLEWTSHTKVEPGCWTDPSKEAFTYLMMERSKDWEQEDAKTKMTIIGKITKKDEETEILEKMAKIFMNPKVLLIMGILMMLGKIWLPKMLLEDIKDVMEMIMKMMFLGLAAKMVIKLEKIYKMGKAMVEEIAVLKDRFRDVQILLMKMEMSMVCKGGNLNRLIKMCADKISELEYRFMDANARPDDYGRKITTYLGAHWQSSKSYMREGFSMFPCICLPKI